MPRRPLLVLLAVAAVVGLVYAFRRPTEPQPTLDPAGRVILYSIDGFNEPDGSFTGETLHRFPVLGKVEVTDLELKRELLAAVEEGKATESRAAAKCFWPRHVVRSERDGRTVDVLVCFQCGNYEVYVGDKRQSVGGLFDRRVRPVFDRILAAANIPTVPE